MNSEERKLLEPIFEITGKDPEVFVNIVTKSNNFKSAKNKIYNILKKQFSDNASVLLNKYLELYFKDDMIFDKICNSLNKFLNNLDESLSLDIASNLLDKNDKINKIVKKYVDRNIKKINFNSLSRMNNTKSTLIQSYCLKNNIEIPFDENIKDDEFDFDNTIEDNYHVNGLSVYFGNIPKDIFTAEEEMKIFKKYAETKDPAIRDYIVEHNLKLVSSIAKRYQGRGLEFEDLIQEGNLGLMKAIDKYDYTRQYKFSTCAIPWIFQAITRAISDKGKTIRIPVGFGVKVNKYDYICKNYLALHGCEPSDEYLMSELDISLEYLKKIKEFSLLPTSLNIPVGENEHGEQNEIGDFIVQENFIVPEEHAMDSALVKIISEVLKDDTLTCDDSEIEKLDEREKEVIKYRCGFYGRVYTLEEVGKIFNVTRERIRQIEVKALKKLRDDKRIRGLAEYTENPQKALEYAEHNGFKQNR